MSPFLRALMGMQAAPAGVEAGGEMLEGNPLTVIGNREQPMDEGPMAEPPFYGNTDQRREVLAQRQNREEDAKLNPRKGMFGTKGTLRDILGVVGDAFLVQSGNQAIYRPQREQEKLADAMVGFTEDDQALAAIERVADLNPEFARQLKQLYDTDAYRKTQQQSLVESRESAAAARAAGTIDKFRMSSANTLNNPGAFGPDGKLSDEAYDILSQQARAANTTPEAIGIRRGMSQREASLIASSNMTVSQQQMLPIQQQRADAATSQAQSSAIRADKAPSGRAPAKEPQPTKAAEEARVVRLLNEGKKLSPGDQIIADRMKREAAPRSGGAGSKLLSDPLGASEPSKRRLGLPRN
jgi:hypothetical protein